MTAPTNGSPAKPRRANRPAAQRSTVTCQVCHVLLPAITQDHLRTHGLTVSAYTRTYSPTLRPAPVPHRRTRGANGASGPPRAPGDPPPPSGLGAGPDTVAPRVSGDGLAVIPASASLVADVAAHLVSDPAFVFRLADELGDVICTGPLRERVRMSLASVFAARLEMHGKAIAALERVRTLLDEDWRLKQGGPMGTPTATRDLAALLQAHGVEVARGEELVFRAAKLILEEQRNRIATGTANVLPGERYQGSGVLPDALADATPEERETIRILLSREREAIAHLRRLEAAGPPPPELVAEMRAEKERERADALPAPPAAPIAPPVRGSDIALDV